MNRKLMFGSWGILGLLGLGSLGNLYDRKVSVVDEPTPVVQEDSDEIDLERDSELLGRFCYDLTPKDLAYITRILYFEGTFDKEIRDTDDLRLSYIAIASVIKNRYWFDKLNNTQKFTNDSLVGVVDKHVTYRSGKRVYQFSCVQDNRKYFKNSSFVENGSVKLATEQMGVRETETAYTTLVDVLTGEAEDPTDGALYYKTKEISFRHPPVRWHGKSAFSLGGKVCKFSFNKDNLSHKYYGIEGCDYVDYREGSEDEN